jgi:hypothetical protein
MTVTLYHPFSEYDVYLKVTPESWNLRRDSADKVMSYMLYRWWWLWIGIIIIDDNDWMSDDNDDNNDDDDDHDVYDN